MPTKSAQSNLWEALRSDTISKHRKRTETEQKQEQMAAFVQYLNRLDTQTLENTKKIILT